MLRMRVSPSVVTCGAAVSACERGGQWARALAVLRELGGLRVEVCLSDVIAYSAAISACARGRRWENAVELFAEMCRGRVQPDAVGCSAVLGACSQPGQALQVFHEMRARRLRPDAGTYEDLIAAGGAEGRRVGVAAVRLGAEAGDHALSGAAAEWRGDWAVTDVIIPISRYVIEYTSYQATAETSPQAGLYGRWVIRLERYLMGASLVPPEHAHKYHGRGLPRETKLQRSRSPPGSAYAMGRTAGWWTTASAGVDTAARRLDEQVRRTSAGRDVVRLLQRMAADVPLGHRSLPVISQATRAQWPHSFQAAATWTEPKLGGHERSSRPGGRQGGAAASPSPVDAVHFLGDAQRLAECELPAMEVNHLCKS
ncbi:unnamed protein product [Prorocentrum cordatum]|uniref:Pentatricopeptide repeat-containing protein n=1 Tax=Prorocentrum cordatum TaxID=2364126 RepID=A0ABN9PDH0_9DINO|nr:unnamed protein product [Polarella glacialis]